MFMNHCAATELIPITAKLFLIMADGKGDFLATHTQMGCLGRSTISTEQGYICAALNLLSSHQQDGDCAQNILERKCAPLELLERRFRNQGETK